MNLVLWCSTAESGLWVSQAFSNSWNISTQHWPCRRAAVSSRAVQPSGGHSVIWLSVRASVITISVLVYSVMEHWQPFGEDGWVQSTVIKHLPTICDILGSAPSVICTCIPQKQRGKRVGYSIHMSSKIMEFFPSFFTITILFCFHLSYSKNRLLPFVCFGWFFIYLLSYPWLSSVFDSHIPAHNAFCLFVFILTLFYLSPSILDLYFSFPYKPPFPISTIPVFLFCFVTYWF